MLNYRKSPITISKVNKLIKLEKSHVKNKHAKMFGGCIR